MAHKSIPTKGQSVLAVMRANGKWLAVVPVLRSGRGEPVIAGIRERGELTKPQARTFDRWTAWLA